MRFAKFMLIAALVLGFGATAMAELQNVEIFGDLRIRGNYYTWDDNIFNRDESFIEMRTRLGVKADFTDEVSAVIEFDSYDIWGEDFRSDYITGVDGRANSVDDVEVYQAYIEANEMWGTPLAMRVGRQEIQLGSEWLVGNNDTSSMFRGLSFDAIRLDYATDMFSVTVLDAKLVENFGNWAEDDVDLYAIYGSYLGLEDIVIDAYWMLVYDTRPPLVAGGVDAIKLHTIGLRGAGTIGAFDFEAEVAYQFGSISVPGGGGLFGWFSPEEPDIDAWGINLEGGYTFDMAWTPRLWGGFVWLEGGDRPNRRLFRRDAGDLAFNRLFSDWEYSEFLDGTDLSNVMIFRIGVEAMPTETISLALAFQYFLVDETDEYRWLFWSWSDDDDLGYELGLYADYQYSEDLVFRAGYAVFWAGDAMETRSTLFDPNNGARVVMNGLGRTGGRDDDVYQYLFIETQISF